MLQKAKSTLLKVLICVCLVCCLVAMFVAVTACNKTEAPTVVGGHVDSNGHLILEMSDGSTSDAGLVAQPGTPGTNGTNGAPGVGIKTVTINNDGDLVITLDNDKEITVEIPAYPANCVDGEEHLWVDLHKVVDANCQTPETWLVVCAREDCNAMYLDGRGDKDETNHLRQEDRSVEATCTKDGLQDVVCADCGAIIEHKLVPAKGHLEPQTDAEGNYVAEPEEGYAQWFEVVDAGKNICEDGGQRLLMCPQCCELVYYAEEIEPTQHTVTADWRVVTEPTLTSTGLLTGPCGRESCGKADATYVLPKLNEKDYTKVVQKAASCKETDVGEKGLDEYTIVIDGQSFTFKVETTRLHRFVDKSGHDHFYSGAIDDPTVEYEDFVDLGHFDNSVVTCKDHGYAEFDCADCEGTGADGKGHIIIKVRGPHDISDKNATGNKKDATCEEDGWIEYTCKTCGEAVQDPVEALGHDWQVEKVEPQDGGGAKVTLKCSRCPETQKLDCTKWEEGDTVPTGCEELGYTEYNYEYELEGDTKSGTLKVYDTEGKVGHRITYGEGQVFVFERGIGLDATYDLDELPAGVIEKLGSFDNVKIDCENPYLVEFNCEGDCEGTASNGHMHCVIQVTAHDWQPDPDGDKAATCTKAGQKRYECSVCGEEKFEDDPQKPALGHEYQATLSADKKTVTLTCSRGDSTITRELDTSKGTNGIEHKDATCDPDTGAGYDRYYYLDANNESKYIEVTIPVSDKHTIGTLKDIDVSTPADAVHQFDAQTFLAQDGVKSSFDNSTPTCQQAGFVEFDCDVCGKHFVLAVYGAHSYTNKSTEATCTTAGATWKECTVCGHKDEEKTIPALGHDWQVSEHVDPTWTTAGKHVGTCKRCQTSTSLELPALSTEGAYTVVHKKPATCAAEGLDEYTLKADTSFTFSLVTPKTAHQAEGKFVKWVSDDSQTYYEGHICDVCKQVVVDRSAPVSDCEYKALSEPVEGEYYLSVFQANLNEGEGERRYLTGNMKNTYYLETTNEVAKAAVVTLHESGDGWALRVDGKYLELVESNGHVNVVLNETQTNGLVWKWNADLGLFTMTVGGTEYYLGSYNTFDTISPSAVSYITGDNAANVGVSQFPAYLGELVIPETAE